MTPATGAATAPSLPRRLAACLYDGLILVAVEMLAAGAWVAATGAAAAPGSFGFQLYVLAVALGFFTAFWTRGETLGMRAWRLRVVGPDGRPPAWPRALGRAGAALLSWAAFGLGFLWVLADPERRAWHDRLSGTRLVLVSRSGRPG